MLARFLIEQRSCCDTKPKGFVMSLINRAFPLLYKACFGKESFAVFAGMKVVGGAFSIMSASSLAEASLGLLPWIASLLVDVVWYTIPVALRKLRNFTAAAGWHWPDLVHQSLRSMRQRIISA